MSLHVDRLLTERARRAAPGSTSVVYSLVFHGAVVATAWFVPELLAKPPQPREQVISVVVVPPQVLGNEKPPPPPPPPRREPPPEPEPEPAPPEPEPIQDVPVLPDKKKKKAADKPPPERRPTPPPKPVEPPPKRIGSPFGSSLGASTQQATLGVEDPNFTYGYYLDRVVAVISANWVRPIMGSLEARFHFRIQRDGTITELRLAATSTSREFNDAAMRAVRASSPCHPYPKSYSEDVLGINLVVK